MCTYPVQPICTFSCVFLLIFINPQYTVLHILSHCTSYSFYFIICSLFHSHLYLYIYIILCYVSLFYCLCYFYFIFYFIIIIIFFLHFPLSGPVLTFHYWLHPVWLCMWQIIKNLEPWIILSIYWNIKQLNCILEKINSTLVSLRDFFKNINN